MGGPAHKGKERRKGLCGPQHAAAPLNLPCLWLPGRRFRMEKDGNRCFVEFSPIMEDACWIKEQQSKAKQSKVDGWIHAQITAMTVLYSSGCNHALSNQQLFLNHFLLECSFYLMNGLKSCSSISQRLGATCLGQTWALRGLMPISRNSSGDNFLKVGKDHRSDSPLG